MSLTKTEQKIYKQVVLGHSNEEIATYFSISIQTVKNHISSILDKKRVESRAKLIANYYLNEE